MILLREVISLSTYMKPRYKAGLISVISVILIPGIGTPSVDDWAVRSAEWRERLSSWKVAARTFVFQHNISLDAHFGWEQLERAGSELQEAIVGLCDGDEVGILRCFLCKGLL